MLLPELRLHSLAMLGTLMTALFFVVRAVRQVSVGSRGHSLLQCHSLLPGAALCWGREKGQQFLLTLLGMASVPPKPPWAGGLGALWGHCEWQGRVVILVMIVAEQHFLFLFPC